MTFMLSAPASSYSINLNESENGMGGKTERYIKYVYDKIKFPKNSKLRYEPFRNGFYGYLNMLEAGKISRSSTLSICDFTLSSNVKRLWIIDLDKKKVLFNTLVAHGMGTGEEFAVAFSNINDSHQSSQGFFTTGETYIGNNGYSLKLNGVDGSYNNNAYDRAIVIHGAEYVCDEFARANKRIGRSHGCPALPVDMAPKIIDLIKNGSCFFIYHTSNNYLKNSYWLKSKINQLPREADLMNLIKPNQKEAVSSDQNEQVEKGNEIDAPTPKEVTSASPVEVKEAPKEIKNEDLVSKGDLKNYNVTYTTIPVKSAKPVEKKANEQTKKVSSIIIYTQNSKGAIMDSVKVK